MSQYVKLILKVSYNRGADLMVCLAAVKVGSTNCLTGLGAELKTATSLGVSRTSLFPQDGAGSDDQGRTTPLALATFLRRVAKTSYGNTVVPRRADPRTRRHAGERIPQVAGRRTCADQDRQPRGREPAAGQILVLGNSLAGYVQTKSGRRVVLMIAVGNVPVATTEGFFNVVNDQARMVIAIQQDL